MEPEKESAESTEHASHLPLPDIDVEHYSNYSTVSIAVPDSVNASFKDAYLSFDLVEYHEHEVETPICHEELEEYPRQVTVTVNASAFVTARLCHGNKGSDFLVKYIQVGEETQVVDDASSDKAVLPAMDQSPEQTERESDPIPVPRITGMNSEELPSTVAYGAVLRWVPPEEEEEGNGATVWYRMYHTSRHEEIQSEPPSVDCSNQEDRQFTQMTADGIVATFPAVLVAFTCHSGVTERSPLFVHNLQVIPGLSLLFCRMSCAYVFLCANHCRAVR